MKIMSSKKKDYLKMVVLIQNDLNLNKQINIIACSKKIGHDYSYTIYVRIVKSKCTQFMYN
jgi:hypothetical protein